MNNNLIIYFQSLCIMFQVILYSFGLPRTLHFSHIRTSYTHYLWVFRALNDPFYQTRPHNFPLLNFQVINYNNPLLTFYIIAARLFIAMILVSKVL